ncbi:MAG: DsrE family protein [Candidatus Hadarchaeia archaeon]
MKIGMILNTNNPEKVWNALRFGITALDSGHEVKTFLLGGGVEAPDHEHEKFNPRGVIAKFQRKGGKIYACGTCLESRDLEEGKLRPKSNMKKLLQIVTESERVINFG